MDKSLIAAALLLLLPSIALGQTHTMYGSNVVPAGASLTIQSGASITAAAGSTITGFGGGAGAVTSVFTRTGAVVAATNDYTFAQIGSKPTTLIGYGITDAQPLDTDLTTWAGLTPSANFQTMVPHTFAQMRTDLGLGTAALNATGDFQAADADLTSWAAITRASGIDTFVATPSSANLRSVVSDENGTGALLFSGATTPNFVTGITIGGAAATGTILQGDGTKFAGSIPTWPTSAGTSGYDVVSDGTNFIAYPKLLSNANTTTQSSISISDVYVASSSVTVATGDFKQRGQYHCVFEITKSAGTGAIVITLRIGTAGTLVDAAIQTYTFGAGTSVADTGTFEVFANFRAVGSGTSAVVHGVCRGYHNLATTGLFNNAANFTVLGSPSPSSGFNSSTATTIGLSFNGSTAFAGSITMVQAQLIQ